MIRPGGNALPPHLRRAPTPERTATVIPLIDHTLLRADALPAEIDRLCDEAMTFGFASVCVNATWVSRCAPRLRGTPVRVCAVVGFPLGAMHEAVKAAEARLAVHAGAHEIDMVMNVGALKSADDARVRSDIQAVRDAIGPDVTLKVILETGLLTPEEIVRASRLAADTGADFVKTSTGFGAGGATVEAVRAMAGAVGGRSRVKASGGIRSLTDARAMVEAGAGRLGCSSGVAIASQEKGLSERQTAGTAGQTRCGSDY